MILIHCTYNDTNTSIHIEEGHETRNFVILMTFIVIWCVLSYLNIKQNKNPLEILTDVYNVVDYNPLLPDFI